MKKNVLFLVFICAKIISFAQIMTTIASYEQIEEVITSKEIISIPTFEVSDLSQGTLLTLAQEDGENAHFFYKPYRFAKLIDVEINSTTNGQWITTSGSSKWMLKIHTQNAKTLSLVLKNLQLKLMDKLYIVEPKKQIVYGPITVENYTQMEEIPTEVILGNEIIVVYKCYNNEDRSTINISQVGYGYRLGGTTFGQRGLSCHVDQTDDKADCFRFEQRGIAEILLKNNTHYGCTGSLINNTNSDATPFLLTANHCVDNTVNPNNLSFRFLNLNNSSGHSRLTFNGASHSASTGSPNDVTLLRLLNSPSPKDKLTYLGWNRTSIPPSSSTTIGYPKKENLKIASDINASTLNSNAMAAAPIPLNTANCAFSFDSKDDTLDFGMINVGCSGSGLLQPDHKICAVMSRTLRISIDCDLNQTNDEFWCGRFDQAWANGSTSATRLKEHLDINNTNQNSSLGTFLLEGSEKIPCYTMTQLISAPDIIKNNGTKYIYTWRSSSNIRIIGNGHSVEFKPNAFRPIGSADWIECDISTPSSCGNVLLATSKRHNLLWIAGLSAIQYNNSLEPKAVTTPSGLQSYNTICPGWFYNIEIDFTNIPIPPNTVFKWGNIGAGNMDLHPSFNGKKLTFKANTSGYYTLTLHVFSTNGCMAYYQPINYTFYAMTNCPEPPDRSKSNVNVNFSMKNTDEAKIFPNPVLDNVNIEFPKSADLNNTIILLKNVYGSIIKEVRPIDYTQQIDMTELNSGIYIIEILNKNTPNICTKVIVH